MKEAFRWFICDRSDGAMIARTVVEATAAYVSAHIVEIMEFIPASKELRSLLVGLFTVIYTALVSSIRKVQESKQV